MYSQFFRYKALISGEQGFLLMLVILKSVSKRVGSATCKPQFRINTDLLRYGYTARRMAPEDDYK